ncbi:Uncharacterised protein [Nocardia africana]|uniref:Uncharacterized protein n=1 Tax=Nocardia africana TaxID=134964 RepID=A0A378WK33_9NOCA|nr:Uncharacterised protein [Nocardia africana]
MRKTLPQRIPQTSPAPTIEGDPHWYAAIARALRATPATNFPCLNDLIPRHTPKPAGTDPTQRRPPELIVQTSTKMRENCKSG